MFIFKGFTGLSLGFQAKNKLINLTKISPEVDNLIKAVSDSTFNPDQIIHRFEVELPFFNPLPWLSAQNGPTKIYFSNKDSSRRYAAIGSIETLTEKETSLFDAITHIERSVKDSNARYFGGTCFDPTVPTASEWKSFGRFNFILPRIELFSNQNRSTLAVNFIMTPSQNIDDMKSERINELSRLDFSSSQTAAVNFPSAVSITEVPSMSKWLDSADDIIESLRSGDMSKVVLARKILLNMPKPIDPLKILSVLSGDSAPTYDFCFQPDASAAFIGSTPETLYRSDSEMIFTEALAGTALIGDSPEQTAAFSKQMCDSQKEQLEQNIVCNDIESTLDDICSSITSSQRTVVKLRTLQHLCTRFKGNLKQGIGSAEIIDSLHPTAAVAGLPENLAMDRIRALETFSRGFYAGPVGYISGRDSEFAVAIRSALITGTNVHLYAGAGLISQSVSSAEWTETQNKLQQFLDILT